MIFHHKERRENAEQKAADQVFFGRLQFLFGHQILLNALHLVDRQAADKDRFPEQFPGEFGGIAFLRFDVAQDKSRLCHALNQPAGALAHGI